jgi:hypothetical protein
VFSTDFKFSPGTIIFHVPSESVVIPGLSNGSTMSLSSEANDEVYSIVMMGNNIKLLRFYVNDRSQFARWVS